MRAALFSILFTAVFATLLPAIFRETLWGRRAESATYGRFFRRCSTGLERRGQAENLDRRYRFHRPGRLASRDVSHRTAEARAEHRRQVAVRHRPRPQSRARARGHVADGGRPGAAGGVPRAHPAATRIAHPGRPRDRHPDAIRPARPVARRGALCAAGGHFDLPFSRRVANAAGGSAPAGRDRPMDACRSSILRCLGSARCQASPPR